VKVCFQNDLPDALILRQIAQIAQKRQIPIESLKRIELERKFSLSGKAHQGVVLICDEYPYVDLEDIIPTDKQKKAYLVVLDHIQDPHNLGALIRSAELSGADGVVIPKDRACMITPTVVKTSAGATEIIPIAGYQFEPYDRGTKRQVDNGGGPRDR
jgi:23S rRNA (guanosine2251-2'-O)-methyltransferase